MIHPFFLPLRFSELTTTSFCLPLGRNQKGIDIHSLIPKYMGNMSAFPTSEDVIAKKANSSFLVLHRLRDADYIS